MMPNIDLFKQQSVVDSVKFYYKNLPVIGNIFTVCVLISKDKKILSRGVAIKSVLDQHNKLSARKLSFSRAANAFFRKENNGPINPYNNKKGFITKTYKIKNGKNNIEKIADELSRIDLGWNTNCKDDNIYSSEKINVFVPYNFPTKVTTKYFNFKSEYQPQPTDEEKKMFKF